MVKISYITITARSDFPTVGLPNLHLWTPTLETLKNQTFKDFEWIIMDVFYNDRPNYFKTIDTYGLKIKHLPVGDNFASKYGLVQTCHQFNKGIIHADGELLFFDADSGMLHPQLMENLWKHYKDGYFVSLGFGSDVTYAPELQERKLGKDGNYQFNSGNTWQETNQTDETIVPTDWIKQLPYGYQGKIIMDHRYRKTFQNTDTTHVAIPPDWYYGISTASLEAVLKVNGFNNAFDMDSALNDVDLGNRLVMAGYKNLAMFRDSYCIEAYAGCYWHPKMRSIRPEIKCNSGLVLYNKFTGRYRANEPYSNADINHIVTHICKNVCPVRDVCKTLPHRAPFFNKNEPELTAYWKKYGMTESVDLEVERELREKEGTQI